MGEAVGVLIKLANEFLNSDDHAKAVKTLLAVCQSNQALPTTKAACRLITAKLLLEHYDNVTEAKSQLRAAELDLRATRGSHLLRCEILDALSTCHRLLREDGQLKETLLAGIKECTDNLKGPDTAAISMWYKYFSFRLANYHLQHSDTNEAMSVLRRMEQNITCLTEEDKALVFLCNAIINLYAINLDAASADLASSANIIETVAANQEEHALRVPYFITFTAMAIASGKMGALKKDSNYKVLEDLQDATKHAPKYSWLPPQALAAIGHILHASLLRNTSKANEALIHLGKAEETVDEKLEKLHIDIATDTESNLSADTLSQALVFIRIAVLIVEQRALLALLSSDFVKAAEYIDEILSLMERFPYALEAQKAPTAMLIGHYATATCEYTAAQHYYDLVKNEPHLHNMAVLGSVIAQLHSDQGSLSGAIELLDQQDLRKPESLQGLPMHERAVAQLVSGIILKETGDPTGARLLLTKALKQAHGMLGSTQLVGQVLNALAPVQQEKHDAEGATQMLESAMTLMKTLGDLPSLITTLHRTQAMQKDEAVIAKTEEYVARKSGELEAKIDAALSTVEHQRIMKWA